MKYIHYMSVMFKKESEPESEPLITVRPKDYVYMDPPYVPTNNKSFVKYTNNGFSLNDHKK